MFVDAAYWVYWLCSPFQTVSFHVQVYELCIVMLCYSKTTNPLAALLTMPRVSIDDKRTGTAPNQDTCLNLGPSSWGFWQEWWTLCWTWGWTTKQWKRWQRCLATDALPLTAIGASSRCILMLSWALNTTTLKSTWSVQRQSVVWSRSMAFWFILYRFVIFLCIPVRSCMAFLHFWWLFSSILTWW